MGHHQLLEGPLVPGRPPMVTRVLAVGGDAARLALLVTNLRLRGYQVTSSADPAAAMAELRQGGQGLSFDLVMIDTYSQYPGAGAAVRELLEFAVREPHLCAYAVPEDGKLLGPLQMKDPNISRKSIYNVASNGQKSPQATPNGPYNTSPSTTPSTITNSPSSGMRARRNNRKYIKDTGSQEVEQDGEHVENEQQPAQKPKKARVVWTDELHKKFVEAYDTLLPRGAAVPKKILELMKDPTLTRENIASHLQKHRLNLQREACTNHLRRSHSRTKHHRSTPQASFPSPNMSSQQQTPPTMMQPDLSATVYINYGMNAHTMPEAPTKSDIQDSRLDLVIHMQTFKATDKSSKSALVDLPPKDMHPGADDPKHNSVRCVGNSYDNSLQEPISEILNKERGPSWKNEFLFSSGD